MIQSAHKPTIQLLNVPYDQSQQAFPPDMTGVRNGCKISPSLTLKTLKHAHFHMWTIG